MDEQSLYTLATLTFLGVLLCLSDERLRLAPSAVAAAGWQFQLANDPMDRTRITEVARQSDDIVQGTFGERIYPTLTFRCEVPGVAQLDGARGWASRMVPSAR